MTRMKLNKVKQLSIKDKQYFIVGYYRLIAIPIIKLLLRTPVTPNMVSWFNIFFSVIILFLFATNNILLAIVLVFVRNILDCVDGGLARVKQQFSPWGGFLDFLGDKIMYSLIFLSIGFGKDLVLLSLLPTITYFFAYSPQLLQISPNHNIVSKRISGWEPIILLLTYTSSFWFGNVPYIVLFFLFTLNNIMITPYKYYDLTDMKRRYVNERQRVNGRIKNDGKEFIVKKKNSVELCMLPEDRI